MFTNSSKFIAKLLQNNKINNFSTAKNLGSLYTWGSYTSGTGFQLSNEDSKCNLPKLVEGFNGNVSKVVMGPFHTAVITGSGELYTMGCGKYGASGFGGATSYEPVKVDFFEEKNLKVVDASLGEHHTIVVTENGEVYSTGFGGTYGIPALDWVHKRTGAIGSGNNQHRATFEKVDGVPKPAKIASGDYFTIAVTEGGEVYNWGCSKDGSLANNSDEGVFSPEVNENFKILKESQGVTIKEIKSASHFSVALMSDGNLYAWGRNNQGAMGIRENLGHVVDQSADLPTKVINQYFEGQKIVDYSVGENTLVVLTEQNQVYWSGLDLAYKPVQWDIPADKKITKIVASKDSFAALTEDNQIYTFNDFVNNARWEVGTEYSVANKSLFDNKNIVDIGGNYGIRYAIVQ